MHTLAEPETMTVGGTDQTVRTQGAQTWRRPDAGVPAGDCRWVSIMYHEIGRPGDTPKDHWALCARVFADQLDWLRDNGFRATSLEDAIQNPDPRSVAITFDDGYIGQYENGFRLLAERGMRATFFVTTDWVERPGFVSWSQLREMTRAGMSVQSHTMTHPFLSTLDEQGVRRELLESKRVLDARLEQETTSLSLPGGDFPRHQLVSLVRDAGYRYVATSEPGVNDARPHVRDPLWIDRLTVRGGQPLGRFHRQIRQDRTLLVHAWAKYRALNLARRMMGREQYHQWRKKIEQSFPGMIRMLGA